MSVAIEGCSNTFVICASFQVDYWFPPTATQGIVQGAQMVSNKRFEKPPANAKPVIVTTGLTKVHRQEQNSEKNNFVAGVWFRAPVGLN